jgi:hypothetical protein
MIYENIEVLGTTHILFRDEADNRVVCPVVDLQCWEARSIDSPKFYCVGGYRVTKETFDDVITYLIERD